MSLSIQKSLTTYNLSPSLRTDDLWIDFMTAISTELTLQRQQMAASTAINDIYNPLTLESNLIDICNKFGYTPNLVLNQSLQYTIEEAETIPYRIRNKTTYNGYVFGFKRLGALSEFSLTLLGTAVGSGTLNIYVNTLTSPVAVTINLGDTASTIASHITLLTFSGWNVEIGNTPNEVIFTSIGASWLWNVRAQLITTTGVITAFNTISQGIMGKGDVFNLYYNGTKLIKAIDWVTSFETFDTTSPILTNPFDGVVPIKNFSTINQQTIVQLDTGRTLDESTLWYLDENTIVIPAKHLAIEYYLDQLYQIGTQAIIQLTIIGTADVSGSVSVELNGLSAVNVPITSGDTNVVIANNIALQSFPGWTATASLGIVTFANNSNGPQTGTNSCMFTTTTTVSGLFNYNPQGTLHNYLFYEDLQNFYQNEADYNRRVPVYPHVGAQLTLVMNETGAYDTYSTGLSYTVPSIELDNGVTLNYLAQKSGGQVMSSIPAFITYGTGSKTLPATSQLSILNPSLIIWGWTLDEPNSPTTYSDSTLNANLKGTVVVDQNFGSSIDVNGNLGRVNSILGQSLNFDGNTYMEMTGNISVPASGITYHFWFNANTVSTSTQTLFDNGNTVVSYLYASSFLQIQVMSVNYTVSATPNTIYMVDIEFTSTTSMSVYLNGVLVTTFTLSVALSAGSFALFIGANRSFTNYYTGLLDQVYLLQKLFTTLELTTLYTDKLGTIAQCAMPINRVALGDGEITLDSNSSAYSVTTSLTGNQISDEYAFAVQSTQVSMPTTFTGVTKYGNIVPYYFEVDLISEGSGSVSTAITVRDQGDGSLSAFQTTGTPAQLTLTIQLATGVTSVATAGFCYIIINSQTAVSVAIEVGDTAVTIANRIANTLFSNWTLNNPVGQNYVTFVANFSGNAQGQYSFTLSSTTANVIGIFDIVNNGNLVSPISGSIEYTTGVWSITLGYTKEVFGQQLNNSATPAPSVSYLTANLINTSVGTLTITANQVVVYYQISNEVLVATDNGSGGFNPSSTLLTDWSALQTYSVGNIALYGGVLWRAVTPILGTAPISPQWSIVTTTTPLVASSINYSSGVINLYFVTATDAGEAVSVNYIYTISSGSLPGTTCTLSYKISTILNITEVSLEDVNKRTIAYATFPAIRLNSYLNHVSPTFIIQ
jgi:hypothetical protein